jgi:phage terminase large subunit GpA-like protein
MNAVATAPQRLSASRAIAAAIARAIAPRKPLTVSQWADTERWLSSKESPREGQWITDHNPLLREPMDCLSRGSGVHDVTILFPIQFGKTMVEINALGYTMDHDPCPIMVVLPDDITKDAWTLQKFNPMIENTPAVQRALTTQNSRDSANQRAFKDFAGGQLFIEHGKTASRLALRTAKRVLVDELDKFVAALPSGEDPLELLKGRTSAYPTSYQRCYIGSPGIKGISRLDELYENSDQRTYHVACPHCGHEQPLTWPGLQWTPDRKQSWYVCRENGCMIEEFNKTDMIARGRWVPKAPEVKSRGYQANCLYYPIGMGPRWLDLVNMWLDAQGDLPKLQVFVQERLAEAWENAATRNVKASKVAERAESYPLKVAPRGVLEVTAGVDTQDNRLCIHIVGWGRSKKSWTLDYDELPGDPAEDYVWTLLTDRLNQPIECEGGGILRVAAVAIDMMGHKTEDVKAYVRRNVVRRPMAIYGAKQNTAVPLARPKLQDINWRGQVDKRGVKTWPVGTVAIKDLLFGWLAADGDPEIVGPDGRTKVPRELADRFVHYSKELPESFCKGLVSEVFNPKTNRYEKRKGGVRNEPLDTWVYAYAAACHPELRLPRRNKHEWDAAEARLIASGGQAEAQTETPAPKSAPLQNIQVKNVPRESSPAAPAAVDEFSSSPWSRRL